MAKRSATAKATRGVSKSKKPISSSSSNPRTTKFRSQLNNLATIAKGGPSKKAHNKEAMKKLTKDAIERKKLLDGIESINMLGVEESAEDKSTGGKKKKKQTSDNLSTISGDSKMTSASFASVWSNCSSSSLNEFFHVWNPNLETHKDALSVIAGLSQAMMSSKAEQSDLKYAETLFKIIDAPNTPVNIITGAILALTYVMRKLPSTVVNERFDSFYSSLKTIMEKYHASRRKTLIKCLIKCFSVLSKAHPQGKQSIEKNIRKMVNHAIRQYKVQNKIQL